MLAAFNVATGQSALTFVPNTGVNAAILPRRLHPTTEFLLDFVTHRLRGRLFRQRNAVLARFRYTRAVSLSEGDASRAIRKPTLRAVRFEGENLLDSTTACGLMWNEGRPLVDLTLEVAVTASVPESIVLAHIPIRIAVEKDHVRVATGLLSDVGLMSDVHQTVVSHAERQIIEGVAADRRTRLEQVIRDRAQSSDPDVEADLLDDDLEMI